MHDKSSKPMRCLGGLDPEVARQAVIADWHELATNRMEEEADDPWALLAPPRTYPGPDVSRRHLV